MFIFISYKLAFSQCFFLFSEINSFFSEIGNNVMRPLGRKKTHVLFGNVGKT